LLRYRAELASSVDEDGHHRDTATYLRQRAQRGSRAKLLAVLAKAPDVEPEPDDRLPV
jgi:hypothetical protein